MEQKIFDNTIIAQYAMTGVPLKVYVSNQYLTITDASDVENPIIGHGMEPNGEMEPFSYQDIDHLLVADNIIDLETYNTAMADQFKPDEPEEAPEGDEEAPEEEGEEGEDDMPAEEVPEEEPEEEEPTTEEGFDPTGIDLAEISKDVLKAKMDVIKQQEKELKDKESALKKEPIDEARFSITGMMSDLKKKEDAAMAARKAYLTYSDTSTKTIRALANKMEALQDERSSLMSDMEQEAEPEGGKIANRYGNQLNALDAKISELEKQIITMGNKDRELRIKYEDAMAIKKKARLSLKSALQKESVNEAASVPSNIRDFAKRRGSYVTSLVKKVATWAEKAGKRISGGTAIGKNYSTLILDMAHQGSEIRIDLDEETVTLFGKDVFDAKSFKKVLDANNQNESLKATNKGIDGLKVGDKVQNQYDSVIATIKSIDGNSVTVVYDDMKSLRNEFGPEAKEFYNQSEKLPMAKFKKAWDRKEYIAVNEDYAKSYGSAMKKALNRPNFNQLAYISSAEYQKVKKLKNFNAADWKWDSKKDLYKNVRIEESVNEAGGTIAKGAYSFADYFGIPVSRLKGFKFDGTDDVEELHKVLGRASSNIKGTENIYRASITESADESRLPKKISSRDELDNLGEFFPQRTIDRMKEAWGKSVTFIAVDFKGNGWWVTPVSKGFRDKSIKLTKADPKEFVRESVNEGKLKRGDKITIEFDDEDGDYKAGEYTVIGGSKGGKELEGMGIKIFMTDRELNSIEYTVNEANSYDSWKERGNQLEKQAMADAINAFGKVAKRKDLDELAELYFNDIEFNGSEYIDAYKIVLKKYKLIDAFNTYYSSYITDVDPAGGHGPISHESVNEDVSSPYIYQVGDLVQNVNPTCPHHGSKGIVMSVEPEELTYSVTNFGDTFKPGMRLTKTLDQLETM
jgi:hypothetical protein